MTYVVAETLAGRSDTIKSYTVAVDGLGKPDTFDPQSDPSVRVLAGRVRGALKNYYATDGRSDPLHIVIKPGSYIPHFEEQQPSAESGEFETQLDGSLNYDTQAQTNREPTFKSDAPWASRSILAGIVFAFLALAAGAYWLSTPSGDARQQQRNVHTRDLPRISFQVLGTGHEPDWYSPSELASALTVVLSRFDNIELTKLEDMSENPLHQTNADDYRILVNSEPRGDAIRFFARFVRTRDQTVVWSRELLLSRPPRMEERSVPDLVGAEIAPIVSPNGILFADLDRQDQVSDTMACLIKGYRYFAARSAETHGPALTCARQLIQSGSTSPPLIAMLSALVLDVYRYGYSGFDEPELPAAHRYALKALELAPGSARAHQALFDYYKVSGDHANAEVAGKRAVSLNPYDIDILGDYGAYLVSRGKFADAMPIMLSVEKLALTTPAWFNVHLYLGARFSGQDKAASRAAGRLKDQTSPMAHLARAMALNASGDHDGAREAVKALAAVEPGFAFAPADELRKRGFAQAVAGEIVRELVGAGLETPTN